MTSGNPRGTMYKRLPALQISCGYLKRLYHACTYLLPTALTHTLHFYPLSVFSHVLVSKYAINTQRYICVSPSMSCLQDPNILQQSNMVVRKVDIDTCGVRVGNDLQLWVDIAFTNYKVCAMLQRLSSLVFFYRIPSGNNVSSTVVKQVYILLWREGKWPEYCIPKCHFEF